MNRREFIKKSGYGAAAFAFAGSGGVSSLSGAGLSKPIRWSIKRKKCEPLGPLDLVVQLDAGQQWANASLISNGTVEPPNGGSGGRTMRSACMPAESCAHYYAMTGDERTLRALKAAAATFREYRHKARAHRVAYGGITKPVKLDFDPRPEDKPTIEYEMISCHVGRNMRGMRAAAHVLRDERLLSEVAEELNWWIDNPLGFEREKHFFDARIFLDEKGKTIGSEKRYTMNMGGSLACAMWLVGEDLGDARLKEYAEDQIINGIAPYQDEVGYFPYNTTHKYKLVDGIALDSNYYHALTLAVLSPLLAYEYWRQKNKFVDMMQRGAAYLRRLSTDVGVMKHPGHIDVIRRGELNFCPKAPFGITADSALIHTRIYKYLGGKEAFEQAAKNLRWMHWNAPACIAFLATDSHYGLSDIASEWGFSHCFRQIMLTAWEGMHLKQKGVRDVEAVFVG